MEERNGPILTSEEVEQEQNYTTMTRWIPKNHGEIHQKTRTH